MVALELQIYTLLLVSILVYLVAIRKCKQIVSNNVYILLLVWTVVVLVVYHYYNEYTIYTVLIPPVVTIIYMMYAKYDIDDLLNWIATIGTKDKFTLNENAQPLDPSQVVGGYDADY
jgi:hypothetical protein